MDAEEDLRCLYWGALLAEFWMANVECWTSEFDDEM